MESGLLFGMALVAAGGAFAGGLFLLSSRLQAQVEAARQWTEVPAVIESAQLSNLGKGTFAPKLNYRYSVGGTAYTGNRLKFGGVSMTKAAAEEILAAHPVGSTVPVRYHPQQHDFAVLRTEADTKSYKVATVVVGLSFVLVGIVVALTR